MSDEPTWTERVEDPMRTLDRALSALELEVPREVAQSVRDVVNAAIRHVKDRDPQRQEDEEAGRLLRELAYANVTVDRRGADQWSADVASPVINFTRRTGPTPVSALRSLRDAIGGEE